MPKPFTDPRLLILRKEDNVCIACTHLDADTSLIINDQTVELESDVFTGHKIARQHIKAGEKIFKYGAPIGSALTNIKPGQSVHTHNVKSDYIATYTLDDARDKALQEELR